MSTLKDMVTWCGFVGWQGVKCYHCGATHNIMIGGGAILCERCGECIVLCYSYHQFPHRKPDFGWNRSVLSWATKNYCRYKDYLQKTHDYLIKNGIIPPDPMPIGYRQSKRKG